MTIRYFFSLFCLFILAVSCEKVIDINLNDANPKPVIESYIERDSACYALLSYTSNFFDNSTSAFISDAIVRITDDAGNSEQLMYTSEGVYRGNSVRGVVGRTYTLSVTINNKTYSGSSSMPSLIPIDSFSTQLRGNFFGNNEPDRYWVYVNYTDPANIKNYYGIRTLYRDTTDARGFKIDYRIADDDLSDGIATRSFTTTNAFFSGDTIVTEFASLDYSTYLYYKTLEDALTGGFSSGSPQNPTTNLSNGALGYFGAWSKDVRFFIVP